MAALHAKLGASSAGRWMNCAGSVRLIDSLPPEERDRGSSYAREGSAAHALAEACLEDRVDAKHYLGHWIAEIDGDWSLLAPGIRGDFEVTEEMAEAVQVYLDEVRGHLGRLIASDILIEERVAPLEGRPEMFGTSDAIIYCLVDGELVVLDLKYGAGVVVEVEENEQAMYYALGALRRIGAEHGFDLIHTVTLVIAQPRAARAGGPVRRWSLPAARLLAWGTTLEAAADATEKPEAPLAAGSWCRFCPAQPVCPEVRRKVLETAQVNFATVPVVVSGLLPAIPLPDESNPEMMSKALNIIPLLDSWAREVEGLAFRRLVRGEVVPGFKLVRKSANRRWADPAVVETELKKLGGVEPKDIYEMKLRGPAQLEKLKAIGKAWVKQHSVRPEGEPVVAPESDPREALPAGALTAFASAPLPATGGGDSLFE
jgi:hypothetical protein